MTRCWLLVVLAVLLPTPARAQPSNCLSSVRQPPGETPDQLWFDQAFDHRSQSAFSCDLGIRASAAQRALDTFRDAVRRRDPHALQSVLDLPLTVLVYRTLNVSAEKPIRIRITTVDEWLLMQPRYFSENHLAVVDCANVWNVEIEPARPGSPGGFRIGLGNFWFQGGRAGVVRLTSVSLFPVKDEWVPEWCTVGPEGR